jgi:Domain of unknown function (DUF4105)
LNKDYCQNMFHKIVPILLFAWLCAAKSPAQAAFDLSDTAFVSLLTADAGTELYSTFGHSALRVCDPPNRVDQCYNYGTFDFDQPNFYVNFCRGKLLYSLNVEPFRYFERVYQREGRGVKEQVLQLNPAQVQRLFDLLQDNAQPENRNYKYDFFYDNCATRIRDIVAKASGNPDLLNQPYDLGDHTMRQLLRPSLKTMPWTQFGIDLVLGQPTDAKATLRDAMFLPRYLETAFSVAKINDTTALVSNTRTVVKALTIGDAPTGSHAPLLAMSVLAGLVLAGLLWPPLARYIDPLFWFALGTAGLIMFLLWFFTDHSATKTNWNLLWALPTHLLVFWRSRRTTGWIPTYFKVAGALAGLALVGWAFFPQEMPLAGIPIAFAVLAKGWYLPIFGRGA